MPTERPAIRFTLIELLIVIAIIGILAALLMPTLSRALNTAKDLQCLNNSRQIGVAENSYQGEYGSRFTPVITSRYKMPVPLTNVKSYYYWQNYLMPYYKPGTTITTYHTYTVQVSGVNVSMPLGIFACPKVSPQDIYNMNNAGFRSNAKMAIAMNYNLSGISTSKVRTPSKTIMLMDMLGDSGTDQPAAAKTLYSWAGTPMWMLSYNIAPRHSDGSSLNVGFVDGHASTINFGLLPDTGRTADAYWPTN